MARTVAGARQRTRALAGLGALGAVTVALTALTAPLLGPLAPGGSVAAPRSLSDLLTVACALVLLAGWARLALGTSLCLLSALLRPAVGGRGPAGPWGVEPTRRLRPTTARRLAAILLGSGLGPLAVAPAGALASQVAAPSSGSVTVVPLPGRPVEGRTPVRALTAPSPGADTVVVRAGDTLWALAAAHLLPRERGRPAAAARAPASATDAAWRRLYAANRGVIGPDPDLIRPGTRLELPAPAPTEGLP